MAGKKWVSTELTKQEWEKVKVTVKALGVKFEPSECFELVHIELLVTDEENDIINRAIDKAVDEVTAEEIAAEEAMMVEREAYGVRWRTDEAMAGAFLE